MNQVSSLVNSASNTSSNDQPFGAHNTLNDLKLDTFLKLMITELQNQDPLNPIENDKMLAQISEMRQIGATDKLTSTLDSVLLGQNIASSTNLIGAEVDAISDDNQKVTGVVNRVSIENGEPKLELDLSVAAKPSIEEGDLGKGTYAYRVVWQGENGQLEGIELSGEDAVPTTSNGLNDYQSVRISNLPESAGPKKIYRTNATGQGDYRLIATLTDGSQSSYLDTTADDARSETRQVDPFNKDATSSVRNFKVSLSKVAEIRAPNS